MAELDRFRLPPGSSAPDFSLPGTDGKTWSLRDFDRRPALAVVWWCNHCPYVQAWEDRTIALARKYEEVGVGFVLINSNDALSHPDDDFAHMRARAKEKAYPFPYLRDDDQEVARRYGALVTPHPMLFDRERRLVYQGRIDDDHERPDRVKHRYLEAAIDALLSGHAVEPASRSVLGCSVKWKAETAAARSTA